MLIILQVRPLIHFTIILLFLMVSLIFMNELRTNVYKACFMASTNFLQTIYIQTKYVLDVIS